MYSREFKIYDAYFNQFEDKELIVDFSEYGLYQVEVDGDIALLKVLAESNMIWNKGQQKPRFTSLEDIARIKELAIEYDNCDNGDDSQVIQEQIESIY